MAQPKILLKGTFAVDDIEVTYQPKSSLHLPAVLEQKTKEIWEVSYAKMLAEGKHVWDGESYRLESFTVQGKKLHLTMSKMKFHLRHALVELTRSGELDQYGNDYFSKGLTIHGIAKTNDGYYVMTQQSGSTTTPTKVEPLGGIVEDIEIHNSKDLFAVNYREFKEEANLDQHDIASMILKGLIFSPIGNIICTTQVELSLNRKEVQERFAQQQNYEVSELIFIKAAEMGDYLRTLGGYKPLLPEIYTFG